jgi:hypothetical protein
MAHSDAAVNFSPELVKAILDCLPKPRTERHRRLLPRILDEWCRTDLRRHLSRESPATMRACTKTVKRIQKHAGQLLEELKAIDSRTLAMVMVVAEGRGWSNVSRANFEGRVAPLDEEREFLSKLSATEPPPFWKPKAGRPRNLRAHLVVRDAAEIFEWYTGKKAARGVDRSDTSESGPFYRFVALLWPEIFGKVTLGLGAALKNWALARSRYNERCPLLLNMDLRHPTWRIFDR